MKVLSLFDGMSCGQIALNRIGVIPTNYYASEVDKFAIAVTQANYPNTIQLGDVTKWKEWDIDWASIDLLIGGSPCQGFSFAGKQLAFDDPRSKLFFVYVDILNHIKSVNPNVKFMLENVKMKKEFLAIISEHLGVEPVFINSALVSAQNRQRYYWCNWEVSQPEDRGIVLADILEDEGQPDMVINQGKECQKENIKKHHCLMARDYKGFGNQGMTGVRNPASIVGRRLNERGVRDDYNKDVPITQCLQVKHDPTKMQCLTTVQKDTVVSSLPPGRYPVIREKSKCVRSSGRGSYDRHEWDSISNCHYRKLTPIECERLQTVLQYIKPVEIVLCSDQAKSFVSAVEKNPKLLKLVSSVESEELKGCAKHAGQSTSASQALTRNIAPQSADTQILTQTKRCINTKQGELNLNASNVGSATTFKQVENVENSAIPSVFMNITEGKITHYGKEALRQIEQSYTEQMNGRIALRLCGSEMMQSAKDALSVLEMMQTNQHSISITSFRLSTKNLEQMLIISYWFAKSAIDGFTHDTTKERILYLNLIDGYTNHVSNTQRYKMLGNGWTVDVIAHIFSQMR